MVLQRTPLANATLSLWSYLLKPSVLDEIFQKHRGRSFEDILKFSTFVETIARLPGGLSEQIAIKGRSSW